MNHLKTISVFLVAVFLLQLLPVRQAVKYFYIDNAMAEEEVLQDVKEPAKDTSFFTVDDQYIHAVANVFHSCIIELSLSVPAHIERYTSCHAADIETPPPNKA